MTTIVINAVSVREGGSLVVLRELLARMAAMRPQWRWRVVTNIAAAGPLPELSNVEYVRFPQADRDGLRTRLWYETGLPALLGVAGADLLFSMTNYLPLRRLPCPALLLVQHAGHFSDVFGALEEARLGLAGRLAWRLKRLWVRASVRRADAVTVQTVALAARIAAEAGVPPGRIRVVPHGPGQARLQGRPARPPAQGAAFRIGYVTKYGVQKNFEVLFAAAAQLRRQGLPLAVVLTLSGEVPECAEVMSLAATYGLGDVVENHGELAPGELERVYASLHAFAFPSLCESFGFPMVEAMAHGLPLLVADVPSNLEVAGAGGLPFPAHGPAALAEAIARLARDEAWFAQRAQASLARAGDHDWARAAAATLALMEEMLAGRSQGDRTP